MKKLLIGLLVCWAMLQVKAEDDQWLTDLPKAQAKAKSDHRLLLMDFTGSDWCPPCKLLKKNILSAPEFLEYAHKNVVLVEVDFPKHTKLAEAQTAANEALAKKHNIEGFPTVIILDFDGKQLKKTVGYEEQTVKDFIAELEKLKKKS